MVIITGVSGSGKTSVQNEMLKRGFKRPINFTTREPRNEEELDEYVFLTEDRYHYLLRKGVFLEHTNYNGTWYGVSASLPEGDVCVVLDPVGREQVLEKISREGMDIDVETIYIDVSRTVQNTRLRKRGDSIDQIRKRNGDFEWFSATTNCRIVDGLTDSDILAEQIING